MDRPVASLIAERFHPIADLFPLLEGEAFDRLVADIQENGLREPIVEFEGLILDGRNRYGACMRAGVDPRFEQFDGADPVAFVLSHNLHRRHLNESQRAMVATRLATLRKGQRASKSAPLPIRQTDAAQVLNVSDRSIRDARVVEERAIPELRKRVERGEVAVSIAAKVAARLDAVEQEKIVDESEAKLRNAGKSADRARKESDLSIRTAERSILEGSRRWNVIYADPPWRFEPFSRDTGLDRAADNHYPTMGLDEICALPIPAADDAVLFLWATAPMLPQALRVMAAWGFEYRSQCIWRKSRAGTGYWFRNVHEILLVGTRGKIPAPAPGEQFESVIDAPLGSHSAKPPAFREVIEEYFPTAELLELFGRGDPPTGWTFWGNESAPDSGAANRNDAAEAASREPAA